MDVHSAIKIIQEIPEAEVDRNFGQGELILANRIDTLHGKLDQIVKDKFIHLCHSRITQLIQMVMPYRLPEDYLHFLQFYGGLSIGRVSKDSPLLMIFGVGPDTDGNYPSIVEMNEDVTSGIKQLYIASVELPTYSLDQSSLEKSSRGDIVRHPFDEALDLPPFNFDRRIYLDLAGAVQQNSILYETIDPNSLKHLGWIKVANTFSDWLELIARDGGRFQRLTDSSVLSEGL